MLPFSRSLRTLAGASALLTAVLLIAGCDRDWSAPGPERTETRSIDLDNSEEVQARLEMGAGEMKVHGGAAKLLEARFVYNRLRMRPEVIYDSSASRGRLVVKQPGGIRTATNKYEWDLAFNDQKPLDLEVKCGAGQTRLDLGELNLRRVRVELGVGQLRMDLHGAPQHDYDVSIHGGIGQATIYLPSDVGIEANAEGGIGDIHVSGLEKRNGRYVNHALGQAKTTIHLDIHSGIGEIRLIAD